MEPYQGSGKLVLLWLALPIALFPPNELERAWEFVFWSNKKIESIKSAISIFGKTAFKYLKQREFIAISLALLLEVTDDLSVKVVSSEM
mgnify:CR=1 FL=1